MIGLVFAGRYRVQELIGSGGMAQVYRAVDLQDGASVAIKILKPEFNSDSEFVRRFQREAMAAQSMLHPNIIKVIGVGEEHGCRFIVMEYVDGMTVKDIIRKHGALDLRHVLDYAVQMTRGIEHAHRNHIIHRDIKSPNIMIDARGIVKIADFGIARATNSATVTANDAGVLGSVHYFSPEQARGEVVDEQSDIYSIGVVIYEMATGRLPFDGEQPVTIALKHIQEEPAPITDYNPELPEALSRIVRKAMSKQKQYRYLSAIEMEEDLVQVMDHPDGAYVDLQEPELLPPQEVILDNPVQVEPNLWEEERQREKISRRAVRRTLRIAAIVVVTVMLVVFLATGGSAWARRTRRAQIEKELNYIVGMETSQVMTQLRENGYKVIISPAFSSTRPRDTIISYQVQGSEQQLQVVLISSSGPETCKMPDLYGMTLEEAQEVLYQYGLEIGDVLYERSDEPLEADCIFKQSVEPDEKVTNGQRVTLTLVMPDPLAIVPSVVGMQLDAARELLNQNQLMIGKVTELMADDIPEGTVVEQSIDENERVDYGTSIDVVVAVHSQRVYSKDVSFTLEIPKGGAEVVVVHRVGDVSTEILRQHYDAGPKPFTFTIESQDGMPSQLQIYIDGAHFQNVDVIFDTASGI